ncbi:MAG: helix-turn-helix transcriptional regulator [Planctomycetes bacterium]|nr:helix-turn-helix transcriptional regulator [Planctomycetota bacterium]
MGVNVKLGGRDYVILPRAEFDRLTGLAKVGELPTLPEADADGNYPAVDYARASLARNIIRKRVEAGLTQRELAKRAGVRHETLFCIESGKHTPSVATITRLEKALNGRTSQNRNGHKR